MLLLQTGIFFGSPIQILTPPDGVNFSKLLAVRCSECKLKLVVKRSCEELENDQHVSPEAKVSRFPFIFFNFSGFSTLLVARYLLRVLFT